MQCSSSNPLYAVVVAAGKGKRMANDIPKQFLPINGKPILMYTLEKIFSWFEGVNIVLVLSEKDIPYWQLLCLEYNFSIPHNIVKGGSQRFFSVQNALQSITAPEAIVAIHDGVRPFVSETVFRNCVKVAQEKGNALPVIAPVESVRLRKNASTYAFDRNNVLLVQTPQCFRLSEIKKAYKQAYKETFTDDASVFEAASGIINIVQGNRENIKITTPYDINIAETLI
jgi:2-C-methyl-D-erythritol 4-phosphate cytidylyltransferase